MPAHLENISTINIKIKKDNVWIVGGTYISNGLHDQPSVDPDELIHNFCEEHKEEWRSEFQNAQEELHQDLNDIFNKAQEKINKNFENAEKRNRVNKLLGYGALGITGLGTLLTAASIIGSHKQKNKHLKKTNIAHMKKHANYNDDDDTISYRLPKEHSTVGMLGTLGTAGIASGILNDFIARKCGSSGKARILAGLATGLPSVGALALAYRKLNKDNPPANTEKEYMDWLKANSEPDN